MPNTDLFDLIKSLNEKEKNYFLQRPKKGKEDESPQYVAIFEAIDAMYEYDEAKLINNLLKSKMISDRRNFPEAKKNLHTVLMKSLRNYHSEKTRLIKLQEARTNISILLEKGLWEQAQRAMRKARKLADSGGLKLYDLEFSLLDRRITRQVQDNAPDTLPALQAESEAIMTQLSKELLLMREYEKIFLIARNENELNGEVEQLPQKIDEIIGNEHDTYLKKASFDSQTHYFSLYGLYYRLKKEFAAAKKIFSKLLSLFEETEGALQELDFQERYLNALNNYFNVCYASDTLHAEYETIISKIQKIPSDNYSLKVKRFYIETYIKMMHFFKLQQYADVVKLAPKTLEKLEEFHDNIVINRRLTFLFNIAIAYFLTEDYVKALQMVNRIINDRKFRIRSDIQLRAKLIRVILLFSMKEYEVARSMIRAVNRDLAQTKRSDQVLLLIINRLDDISKLPHGAHRSELLKLYKTLTTNKEYLDEEMSYWLENYLGLPHQPQAQADH